MFPGSSNLNAIADHAFVDPYTLCRDATFPGVIGYDIFKYFYHNREKKITVCNAWKKNLEKLIFPEVFVDIDLVKALIKSYSLVTKSFEVGWNYSMHTGSCLFY